MPTKLLLPVVLALGACTVDTPLAYSSDSGAVAPDLSGATAPDLSGSASSASDIDKLDILFVIDDSETMYAKVEALKANLPTFTQRLDALGSSGKAASYHIGVVTSDLGAPGLSCGANGVGLGAKLQQRGLAVSNDPTCKGPVGSTFVDYDPVAGNNLPPGQDLPTTLKCMMSVVDPVDGSVTDPHTGCMFPSTLGAAYHALHDDIPENEGFLRADASLVVVWLTDGDDCSVDPSSTFFTDDAYGPLNRYRCVKYSTACSGSDGSDCYATTAARGSLLSDLSVYQQFFASPASQGGVKTDPTRANLFAIMGPVGGIGTQTSTGDACGTLDGQPVTSCTTLVPSCQAGDITATPSSRLFSVVTQSPTANVIDTCSIAGSNPVNQLDEIVTSVLAPGCQSDPLAMTQLTIETNDMAPNRERPNCVVTVVTSDGTQLTAPYCYDEPGVTPCWHEETSPLCPAVCNPSIRQIQQLGIVIDAGGSIVLEQDQVHVSCDTLPVDPTACQ